MYITIIDPIGGVNMADNSSVAVSHRVLYDKKTFYGVESLVKPFGLHPQRVLQVLTHMTEQPSGQWMRFTWEHK